MRTIGIRANPKEIFFAVIEQNGGENKILTIDKLNLFDNTISGAFISRPCNTCPPNEREISVSYNDPSREYLRRSFEIRHYVESGEEYLRLHHVGQFPSIPEGAPTNTTLPEGMYILKKVL